MSELCPICKQADLEGDYNKQKLCEDCDRIVCEACVALTDCQTIWGVCVECFDYLCEECEEVSLKKGVTYLQGVKEYLPLCEACSKKVFGET